MAVTISETRLRELLDTETRVDVVVEQIISNGYMRIEQILRILGTTDAMWYADELREKDRKEKEETIKRYTDQQKTVTEESEDEEHHAGG